MDHNLASSDEVDDGVTVLMMCIVSCCNKIIKCYGFCGKGVVIIVTKSRYTGALDIAENDAQNDLRSTADQAALEQPARKFRGVGAASLFKF